MPSSEHTDSQRRVAELIERGLERYGQGDLEGAVCEWRIALRLDPDSRRAREFVLYVENNYQIVAGEVRAAVDPKAELSVPFGLALDDLPLTDDEDYESFEIVRGSDPMQAGPERSGDGEVHAIAATVDDGWTLDRSGEVSFPQGKGLADFETGGDDVESPSEDAVSDSARPDKASVFNEPLEPAQVEESSSALIRGAASGELPFGELRTSGATDDVGDRSGAADELGTRDLTSRESMPGQVSAFAEPRPVSAHGNGTLAAELGAEKVQAAEVTNAVVVDGAERASGSGGDAANLVTEESDAFGSVGLATGEVDAADLVTEESDAFGSVGLAAGEVDAADLVTEESDALESTGERTAETDELGVVGASRARAEGEEPTLDLDEEETKALKSGPRPPLKLVGDAARDSLDAILSPAVLLAARVAAAAAAQESESAAAQQNAEIDGERPENTRDIDSPGTERLDPEETGDAGTVTREFLGPRRRRERNSLPGITAHIPEARDYTADLPTRELRPQASARRTDTWSPEPSARTTTEMSPSQRVTRELDPLSQSAQGLPFDLEGAALPDEASKNDPKGRSNRVTEALTAWGMIEPPIADESPGEPEWEAVPTKITLDLTREPQVTFAPLASDRDRSETELEDNRHETHGSETGDASDLDGEDQELSLSSDLIEGPKTEDSLDESTKEIGSPAKPSRNIEAESWRRASAFRELRALSVQLASEMDDEFPLDGAGTSLRSRLTALIGRAQKAMGDGEKLEALAALELAYEEQPDSAVTQKVLHSRMAEIDDVYTRFLGSGQSELELAVALVDIASIDLEHRSAFLASRVEMAMTLDDLLDISGMPRIEALRYLSNLVVRGILCVN